MDKIRILPDGSMEGRTFSGYKYKGEYPSPKVGEETYREFYDRVQKCIKKGFHLGDLSWSDWQDYLYGSDGGGGQYVSNYVIGKVPDHAWVSMEDNNDEDDW